MARVFISFASPDVEVVRELAAEMRDHGHDPFFDRDRIEGIRVGEDWRQRLYRELRGADAVVCVVTTASVASKWCSVEIAIADAIGCRLLPVRAEAGVVNPLIPHLQYTDRVADPGAATASLLRSLRALELEGRRGWRDGENPYPGLEPFTSSDAAVFHGRGDESREVAQRLNSAGAAEGGLLAIIGPSGSGKSSLLAAGVLPLIAEDPRWLALPPWVPGADPVAGLARSIAAAGAAHGMSWSPQRVRESLDADVETFARLSTELLTADVRHDRRRLLVTIDQAEELFTRASATARAHFAQLLRVGARGPVRTLATLRSEYLDDLRELPELARTTIEAYVLAPLEREMLRVVVEGPARVAGLHLQPELTPRLVADTGGGEALPLLAFTLHELAADIARGGTLTTARYAALGGVRGALSRHADHALAAAVGRSGLAEDEVIAGLVRLVTIDDSGRRARRRIRMSGVPDDLQVALQVLVDRRLLVVSDGLVGVAHEALLTAWDPLDRAVTALDSALRTARAVEQAAAEWRDSGSLDNYLWDGERLVAAEAALRGPAGQQLLEIDDDASAFLSAGRSRMEERSRREERNRRRTLVGLVSLAVLAITVAGLAVGQYRTAQAGERSAAARGLIGQAVDLISSDPQRALQYGVAAAHLQPGQETENVLLRVLNGTRNYRATLTGHTSVVRAVAFAPVGGVAATAGADRSILLWDLTDPTSPKRLGDPLVAHTDTVWTLAFSPDGRTLASAGDDGTVLFWDVTDPSHAERTGTPIEPGRSGIGSVTFSPDGRMLASTNDDGTASVWDVSSLQNPRLLGDAVGGHSGIVWTTAFSPDGLTLATGGQDGFLVLWDVSDHGRPVRISEPVPAQSGGSVNSVAFDPRRPAILATGGGDGTARLWDVGDRTRPRPVGGPVGNHSGVVRQVAFQHVGETTNLATASADRSVVLSDVTDGESTAGHTTSTFVGHSNAVHAVAISPDGRTMISGSADATAVVWDLAVTGYLAEDVTGFPAPAAAVSPVVFDRTGRTLVAAGPDGALPLWDIGSDRPAPAPDVLSSDPTAITAAAFTPDRTVLATATDGGGLSLWDSSDEQRSRRVWQDSSAQPGTVRVMAVSPDSRLLAVGGDGPGVQLWDIGDPARPVRAAAPVLTDVPYVTAVAFGPDGHTLVTAGGEGRVTVWDVSVPATPAQLSTLAEHAEQVLAVVFGPDGRTLVTAGRDSKTVLWDLTDPAHPERLGQPLVRQFYGVTAAAVTPDGRGLITAGGDSAVVLWDISDRQRPVELGVLWRAEAPPRALSLTLGGDFLVMGGSTGIVRVLRLSDLSRLRETAVADACTRSGAMTPEQWTTAMPSLGYEETCVG